MWLRRFSTAATVLVVGMAAGCGGSEESAPETTATEPPAAEAPAREAPAERPQRPPVGDGEGGVELEPLGEFEQPLYVTQPADGDSGHLYVVEQCGRIQRVPVGGGEPRTFLDLTDLVTCGGEQGLLSVAFAPDYRRSGLLYVYYTDAAGDQRIVEYRRAADGRAVADPGSARELLRMEDFASNHNGGLLLFGPDDRLWVGTGDGGGAGDPERNGQDLGSLLGKLLRVDPDPEGDRGYSVPDDNPHLDDPGARPEIVVHGLRNPWRFSFDRETGDLWIGDVGQSEREEIDTAPRRQLDAGLDFGWSAFEGSRPFHDDQRAPEARAPTHEYGREGGCSVTGGHVVRDPGLRSLYGRYLYGDFCAGELRSFTARPGAEADDDIALGPRVEALSSFGEDAAGHIYVTSLDGPVYRLAPKAAG